MGLGLFRYFTLLIGGTYNLYNSIYNWVNLQDPKMNIHISWSKK